MDARPLMPSTVATRSRRGSAAALLVVAAGLAFGALGEASQARFGDRPQLWVVADFLGGAAFLISGAIAWVRRPASRIGVTLLAIGLAWFVGTHVRDQQDWIGHIARSLQGVVVREDAKDAACLVEYLETVARKRGGAWGELYESRGLFGG